MKKIFELSFAKKVFLIATPIMIQNLVTATAQLVDNLMVGSLGEEAIAAVGSANMIFSVIMFMGFGISEGMSVFLAQQKGAKQNDKMQHTFVTGIYFAIILGLLTSFFVYTFKENLIHVYLDPKETLANTFAYDYLNIAVFSYLLILINITIGSAFRATGHRHQTVVAGVSAIIINTSLNSMLIYGNFFFPEMGVKGAALATVISRVIELLVLIFYMYKYNVEFLPKIKDFISVPLSLIKQISLKSIPLISNEFLWSLGQAILLSFYGSRAQSDLAAIQMSNTVTSILFTVMGGFSVAVSILIGHKLGENNIKQAISDAKNLLKLGVCVGFAITLIAALFTNFLPLFYQNVEQETLQLSQQFLLVSGLFFANYMIAATSFFILRAGGDTKGVLLMDAGFMWFITIPLAYFMAYHTSLPIIVVFFLVQTIELFKSIVGVRRIKKKKWARNLVNPQ